MSTFTCGKTVNSTGCNFFINHPICGFLLQQQKTDGDHSQAKDIKTEVLI